MFQSGTGPGHSVPARSQATYRQGKEYQEGIAIARRMSSIHVVGKFQKDAAECHFVPHRCLSSGIDDIQWQWQFAHPHRMWEQTLS